MLKIKLNPDKDTVNLINERLARNNNYCPCAVIADDMTEDEKKDYKCPCKEFRESKHKGECHCGKYIKE